MMLNKTDKAILGLTIPALGALTNEDDAAVASREMLDGQERVKNPTNGQVHL